MSGLTSQTSFVIDPNLHGTRLILSNFKSEEGLFKNLERNHSYLKTKFIADSTVIDDNRLEDEINIAIGDWKQYPWNKTVAKDLFLDYVLPYKVHGEYPDEWRKLLRMKLKKTLTTYAKNNSTTSEDIYDNLIVNGSDKWFKYSTNFTALTGYPSFNEMNLIKKGDCLRLAYLHVYLLRTAGIPATVDLVPYWGNRNGGHAVDVYHHASKLHNGTIRSLLPSKNQFLDHPPKVFRITFRKTNMWTDSIQPLIKKDPFCIEHLYKNDNLIDVTSNYTNVKNIRYTMENGTSKKLGYICVYNYCEWKPIYYGKISNQTISFPNMATNMLYRIALPTESGLKFIGKPFIFNNDGSCMFFDKQSKSRSDITLGRSSDEFSWIRKKEIYTLSVLNNKGYWTMHSKVEAKRDSSITFLRVRKDHLYKLTGNSRIDKCSRPFIYNNGVQLWY
ncbi:hypothetical protein [Pedobacter sp. Leaf41]|uniref:hypothetical protein n=1 Tax=Pedobacter sp. Leaf41 TaxID=1736218 RepID=UPI0012FC794D|nr:hypothetical protein [Pedobacter sp. Leaf41]